MSLGKRRVCEDLVVDRHPLPHLVEDQPRRVGRDRGAELVLGAEPLEVIARREPRLARRTDLDQAHLLQGGTSTGRDDELGQVVHPRTRSFSRLIWSFFFDFKNRPLEDVLLV